MTHFTVLFLKVLSIIFSEGFLSDLHLSPVLCLLAGIHSHSHLLLLSGLLFYPLDNELFLPPLIKLLNSLMAAWILTIFISQNLTCCFQCFSSFYFLFLTPFYYGCHISSTHFTLLLLTLDFSSPDTQLFLVIYNNTLCKNVENILHPLSSSTSL